MGVQLVLRYVTKASHIRRILVCYDMANQVRIIQYKDRLIEAYIYKNKLSLYDAVYIDDDSLRHVALENPEDPECRVARNLQIGINFDSVAQLDTLISSLTENNVEKNIPQYIDKIIAHWEKNGYETEWCASRSR
jgi:hypothetical protein